jgi:glycosyltransferase involved in cell wall biosynthesis
MKYRIAIYCPDQHIKYDIHTLNQSGVGGGITARIRLAHAFAENGHQVSLFVNCPFDGMIQNVRYQNVNSVQGIETDVFIVSTSSGNLDISKLSGLSINAGYKVLMVHGLDIPIGYDITQFDQIVLPSNFMLEYVIAHWPVIRKKSAVFYHGVADEIFTPADYVNHDPYRLVYVGHPSKGLDTAIAILRILKNVDPEFTLHVYGGYQLWGEKDQPIPMENGLIYHGLVGQKQLAQELAQMGFCINLQSRQEPFGMVVTEGMRKGCIVLASPVGALSELIRNGFNGFLIPGDHLQNRTREDAARCILNLMDQPAYRKEIQQNAMRTPLSWKTISAAWTELWDLSLHPGLLEKGYLSNPENRCAYCGTQNIQLIDGFHCIECGYYQNPSLPVGLSINHNVEGRYETIRM